MTIPARQYRDERDLEAMRRLLMSVGGDAYRTGYLHAGDVVWRVWDTLIAYDPRRIVGVWEAEGGNLLGFALFYPMYAGFDLQVHPGHRGGELEEGMLAWAEGRALELTRQEGHAGAIDAWDGVAEDAGRVGSRARRERGGGGGRARATGGPGGPRARDRGVGRVRGGRRSYREPRAARVRPASRRHVLLGHALPGCDDTRLRTSHRIRGPRLGRRRRCGRARRPPA